VINADLETVDAVEVVLRASSDPLQLQQVATSWTVNDNIKRSDASFPTNDWEWYSPLEVEEE
jgi:hypothetical protein